MKGNKIGVANVLAGVAVVILLLSMYIGWYGDALLRLKERPAQFLLHRSFDFLSLRLPMSPVDISFAASQHRPTDKYEVFVTTFPYPMMHVDSVTMKLE